MAHLLGPSFSIDKKGRHDQIMFRHNHYPHFQQDLIPFQCHPGQDKFHECLSSVYSILPVVVATLVLFIRVLHALSPHRPQWMKPFVEELNEQAETRQTRGKRSRATTALLILVPIGLTLQLACALYPSPRLTALLPVVAWVMHSPGRI